MVVTATPLATGLDAVVSRYAEYGPLAAAFLANLLATFGDKGQLVVITLASRYDAKRVFVGSMAAFGAWSAVEVAFGAWVTRVIPDQLMTLVTGTLFLLFGLWTLRSGIMTLRVTGLPWPLDTEPRADTDGGRVLPAIVQRFSTGTGGVLTSFVFIAFAEFGDKTQLLTINLAATFPDHPWHVFVGVFAALALRTGIDAFIGERAERAIPSGYIELGAAAVFVAFGLAVLGIIGTFALVAVIATTVASVTVSTLRQY